MPLFPSDFKKFKHVSNDDKTVTLQHPAGHQIIIAKHAVKGDLRKQLDAMCEGGKVSEKPQAMNEGGALASIRRSEYAGSGANAAQEHRDNIEKVKADINNYGKVNPNAPNVEKTPEQRAKKLEQDRLMGYAAGGNVQRYAEGTPDEVIQQEQPSKLQGLYDTVNHLMNPPQSPFAQAKAGISDDPAFNPIQPGKPIPKDIPPEIVAEAQKIESDKQSQVENQEKEALAKAQAQDKSNQALGLPPDGTQTPQNDTTPIAGMATGIQPAAIAADPNALAPNPYNSKGFNQEVRGINDYAAALEEKAGRENVAYASDDIARHDIDTHYKNELNDINNESAKIKQEIADGDIDPAKYWTGDKNGKGSHSRLMSVLGIIIAGFNPTNMPNAAGQLLDHQMQANLDAQKENLNSKKSLLSANLQRYRNLQDATTMTRIQQHDILQNELAQAAALATSPVAKAAAMKEIGQLQQKRDLLAGQFAQKRAVNQIIATAGQDPSKIDSIIRALEASGHMDEAKNIRARHVPDMGLATTMEGAKGVTEMKAANDSVKSAVQRLREITSKTGKSLTPNIRAEADTIRSSLIGALRVPITGPGAMNEGEREMLMNMIPDTTGFTSLDSNSIQRLNSLEKIMANKFENMARANGLQIQNPTSLGKDTKMIKGVLYKISPDGKSAVRVKYGKSAVRVK